MSIINRYARNTLRVFKWGCFVLMILFVVVTVAIMIYIEVLIRSMERARAAAVPPQGIWISADPNLILYFCDQYLPPRGGPFLGYYYISGRRLRIQILYVFDHHPDFTIETIEKRENNRFVTLYRGTWEVIGNHMYYFLFYDHLDRGDLQKIIFTRTEDYEPINPEDWFP